MKTRLIIGFLLLGLISVGCQKETTTTTTSTSNNVSTGGTSGGGGTGSGSTTGSTGGGGYIGGSCYGSPQDGTGPGNSIWHFDIQMAGHQDFYPGILGVNESSQWGLINIQEGAIAFQTDARLKVRFKVHPQPVAPVGQEYCYGRQTGSPTDAFKYNKVKFNVFLRDILQHNTSNQIIVGNRYQPRYNITAEAGGCTPILDFSNSRNLSSQDPNYTLLATAVEITYVRSDSACQECQNTSCQYESYYCPSETSIRAASCWSMTMQISTDVTQDFN